MRVFWVNQGQTFDQERRARVLWAPKRSRPSEDGRPGRPRSHWERMLEAQPGDLVLHYSGGEVRAWSSVLEPAYDGAPPFEDPTTRWSSDGRVLRVDIEVLDVPVARDEIPFDLRTSEDSTRWPFRTDGALKQSYLHEIDGALAEWLLDRLGLSNEVAQNRSWPRDRDARPELTYSGDRPVVSYQRGEQSSLRRALFGRRLVDACALCGRELPVAMLIAAHIKRRADTSNAERRRTDNVMPACVLGCDDLFELGYVTVSKAGIIEAGPRRRPMTSALEGVIDGLLGRTCSFWDESRERYFAHHREFQRGETERYGLS